MRRNLWTALVLALVFALASPLLGQGLPMAAPEEVGLSSERLERIRASYQQDVDRGELVGAVTLIARRGRIAHFEAFGTMDGDLPMRRDALFAIASMTKPITSVAAMILFEEGKLLLDDEIAHRIPSFAEMQVVVEGAQGDGESLATEPAARPITARDLLRHTSGLGYSFMVRGPLAEMYRKAEMGHHDLPLRELVDTMAELPLAVQPGTRFQYGVSTDVLGYLVEVVSGMPFDRFLAERVFAPLKMADTAFHVPKSKISRFATHYVVGEGGLAPGPRYRDFRTPPPAPSGGAGLVSTAADYVRFLQMLLNGGTLDGVRVLSRKTIELMFADHLLGIDGMSPAVSFGLGFAVRTGGGREIPGSIGTASWGGIYNTFFWIDPQEELIAVFMTQITPFGHNKLRDRFRALVYQAIDD